MGERARRFGAELEMARESAGRPTIERLPEVPVNLAARRSTRVRLTPEA